MYTKIHILSTLAGLLLLWRFYCFPILFVVVRGSQFCASSIACCVGIVHLETEERRVFLPTRSIAATVLSASSPLFVSDELLKLADQFEYPSNISMSRTCVYSPAKFNCCNMFQKPRVVVQVVVSILIGTPADFRTSWKCMV